MCSAQPADTVLACLNNAGSVREMAALLLGRLLTRPDMGAALEDFLSWTEVALRTVDALSAPFLMAGNTLAQA